MIIAMITKTKNERIKDILIDHVYDYCYNEKIQKLEGDGIKLEYEDPKLLEEPSMKILAEQIMKSKKIKGYFGIRETEYCQIMSDDKLIHSSLSKKLKFSGFKKSKKLEKNIIKATDFLIARSFFSRNNPIKTEVRLTEKGLRHYLEGKSFEDNYTNYRHSNIGIMISIISIIIATIAIIMAD